MAESAAKLDSKREKLLSALKCSLAAAVKKGLWLSQVGPCTQPGPKALSNSSRTWECSGRE